MKTQYSDIGNGLSTKKYVSRRSNSSGIDNSSAPAPHLTVLVLWQKRTNYFDIFSY